MDIQAVKTSCAEIEVDWLIAGVTAEFDLAGPLQQLDEALDGKLTRLWEAGDLTGKPGELLAIHDTTELAAERLMLVGLGKSGSLTSAGFDKSLMTAIRAVSKKRDVSVAVALPEGCDLPATQLAEIAAAALGVGSVGQDIHRKEPGRFPFATAQVVAAADADLEAIAEAVNRGAILGTAVNITRELVNRPAMEIYPITFAARAEQLAKEYNLTCTILEEAELRNEKMGSMLGVAVGSDQPPRMVILKHCGGPEDGPVLALVGKGVTFDSGGLSLKPSDGMKTMKCDMAGAATVLGAMTAIAKLNLPVNVIGYMGLVENMVSGSSYKLGDVLTARNGTTIEVLNTDAEGRLVLADVLSYAADHGADRMIDLATLTGACVVALGEQITGAFTNNQPWCDEVLAASSRCGEDVWQLPTFDYFSEQLNSDVADCKNVGPRWGGAITAAKFLEKFVSGKPWVHLDIAGPSFASNNEPHREGGGTGCMVRTLVEIVAGQQSS